MADKLFMSTRAAAAATPKEDGEGDAMTDEEDKCDVLQEHLQRSY